MSGNTHGQGLPIKDKKIHQEMIFWLAWQSRRIMLCPQTPILENNSTVAGNLLGSRIRYFNRTALAVK
jgi:hypothetical protein